MAHCTVAGGNRARAEPQKGYAWRLTLWPTRSLWAWRQMPKPTEALRRTARVSTACDAKNEGDGEGDGAGATARTENGGAQGARPAGENVGGRQVHRPGRLAPLGLARAAATLDGDGASARESAENGGARGARPVGNGGATSSYRGGGDIAAWEGRFWSARNGIGDCCD